MNAFVSDKLGGLLAASREQRSSPSQFDDGGQFRIEIPTVEGAVALRAGLERAKELGVPVHRVSQGTGITVLSDDDIREMARLGAENAVEVCLFVGPRAPWDASAAAGTPDGKFVGWRNTSVEQLGYAYDDVVRAVELGIRSILVADEGLIGLLASARKECALPSDLVVKASAVMGITNPLGAKFLADLGADTLNVVSSATVGELAAFRAACSIPLDLYVESPDGLGGFLRYHEVPEIVRVAAPVHLKFGLRNAPNIYPSGQHLRDTAVSTTEERVQRAAAAMRIIEKDGRFVPSPLASPRPGIPVLN